MVVSLLLLESARGLVLIRINEPLVVDGTQVLQIWVVLQLYKSQVKQIAKNNN